MSKPPADSSGRRRADVSLVERGIFPSRARAQEAIEAGLVTADGARVRKPSDMIRHDAALEARAAHPYVSRGGVKLAAALAAFAIDPRGGVCLDVGSSTGGFTDVLLRRGAKRVYAVDVGTGQLHPTLAADPRVVSLERTDARNLSAALVPEPVDCLVADVSFISLKLVLPGAVALVRQGGSLAVLVKPQFEAGPSHVRKGIVRDETVAPCRLPRHRNLHRLSRFHESRASSPRRLPAATATASSCSGRDVAEEVQIARLGARGDGVVDTPTGQVFVPYALAGEDVTIERDGGRGHLVEILSASPERVVPFCPYFGRCGGCATQHMTGSLLPHLEGAKCPPRAADGRHRDADRGSHRRPWRGSSPGDVARPPSRAAPRVGFMAARSHEVIEIDHCPIAEAMLSRHAPIVAAKLAASLAATRKPLDIQITATDSGLDVDLRGLGPLKDSERPRLADLAAELDLARLSLHGETIVERRAPVVRMGRAAVVLPPGSFCRRRALARKPLPDWPRRPAAMRGRSRIFSRAAGHSRCALRSAPRSTRSRPTAARSRRSTRRRDRRPACGRSTSEVRDLFRRPLLSPELAKFDAVVLDPPRAGAEAQARQLATAKVPLVVSVSCDPGTFARDAAILIAGGYRLERVATVDQFKYSPHVELVGVLRKERARKG